MKKIITVLLLCSTLIVSAQRVLEFNRADLVEEGKIKVFEINAVFVLYPENFSLFIANVKEEYIITSDIEKVEVEGIEFFAFSVTSSEDEDLITFVREDFKGVIMVRGDNRPIVFYNE